VGPIVLDFAFEDWRIKRVAAGKPMFGVKLGILDDDGNEYLREIGEVAVFRKGSGSNWGFGVLDEEGYFWSKGEAMM